MQHENILTTVDPAAPYGTPGAYTQELSEEEVDQLIQRAIEKYGKKAQTQMLFEEMSELQNALCKLARHRDTVNHVCEEIADVVIMCLQVAQIHGLKCVEEWINYKLLRLKERLDE